MITIEPHIQGLIFDCDGTLVDTMPLHYWAWQETLRSYGATFPELLFYDLAGMPSDNIVERLNDKFGYQLQPGPIAIEKEELFLKNLTKAKPVEPVFALVKQYKGQLPMAVATGGIPHVVTEILKALDVAEGFFEAVVTAHDVENGKPAPDTFLEAARRINVAPQFCQVFEDSDLGLTGAQRAGMVVTDVRPFYKNQI